MHASNLMFRHSSLVSSSGQTKRQLGTRLKWTSKSCFSLKKCRTCMSNKSFDCVGQFRVFVLRIELMLPICPKNTVYYISTGIYVQWTGQIKIVFHGRRYFSHVKLVVSSFWLVRRYFPHVKKVRLSVLIGCRSQADECKHGVRFWELVKGSVYCTFLAKQNDYIIINETLKLKKFEINVFDWNFQKKTNK